MRSLSLRRAAAGVALAGITSLGLVACGSDSDSADTTVAAEAAVETTAAAEEAAVETTVAAEEAAADTTVAAEEAAADTTVAAAAEGELMDIVDTAVGAGSFTTLAKLLTDAGLVETLKGAGPFTVFAPTDEAFAAVPADTLAAIAADKAQLTKVLTYHVVSGAVMAADVTAGDVPSVEGQPIKVTVTDGKVMVNDANVTAVDIKATNGVIHVIDKVLLPPDL